MKSSCVFHQITSLGCAYPDFRCMCQKFEALNDPCVADTIKQRQIESCLSGCETYQRWGKSSKKFHIDTGLSKLQRSRTSFSISVPQSTFMYHCQSL